MSMKPTPKDWPRLSASVHYREPAAMIAWLCEAFDFVLRLKVDDENGRIEHSELCYGEAVIMLSEERELFGTPYKSPLSAGCNTQGLMLYVDDVDAHCAKARMMCTKGAKIVSEPALHDYGAEYWADRSYGVVDPEGHAWWFTQRVRTAGVDE
jgi:uncharacterized glyoxalase superfamily protein PhnB